MAYHSKKAIVSMLVSITSFFYLYLNFLPTVSDASSTALPAMWGSFILRLLAIQVVIKIIVLILFAIVLGVKGKDNVPSITDERDHLIELKAVRNFCFAFFIGFFASMAAVAWTQSVSLMFQVLVFNTLFAGLVIDVSYIVYYERGL